MRSEFHPQHHKSREEREGEKERKKRRKKDRLKKQRVTIVQLGVEKRSPKMDTNYLLIFSELSDRGRRHC